MKSLQQAVSVPSINMGKQYHLIIKQIQIRTSLKVDPPAPKRSVHTNNGQGILGFPYVNKTAQHQLYPCTPQITASSSRYNFQEKNSLNFEAIQEHNKQKAIATTLSAQELEQMSVPKEPNDAAPSAVLEDWRSFRATLVNTESLEKMEESKIMIPPREDARSSSGIGHFIIRSMYWAHTLERPEVGCLLVATEKLQSHAFFSNAVILLVSCSGDFRGILLNKTMPFCMMQEGLLSRWNYELPVGLVGCSTFFGGPSAHEYSANKLLLQILSCNKSLRGLQPLVRGLYLGGEEVMESTSISNVAREEIQLYLSELKWTSRHLAAEIQVFQWWHVVACSSSLVFHCPRSEMRRTVLDAIDQRN